MFQNFNNASAIYPARYHRYLLHWFVPASARCYQGRMMSTSFDCTWQCVSWHGSGVKAAIWNMRFRELPQAHLAYAPSLAPCDFHMFLILKYHLKGNLISTKDVLKSAMWKLFNSCASKMKSELQLMLTMLKNKNVFLLLYWQVH